MLPAGAIGALVAVAAIAAATVAVVAGSIDGGTFAGLVGSALGFGAGAGAHAAGVKQAGGGNG
jgi:hypothetical protein